MKTELERPLCVETEKCRGQTQQVCCVCGVCGVCGLTLTLLDVSVELLQRSQGEVKEVWVQQQLQQGGGDVLTGRHAGRLGHAALGRGRERERGRERGGERGRDRKSVV